MFPNDPNDPLAHTPEPLEPIEPVPTGDWFDDEFLNAELVPKLIPDEPAEEPIEPVTCWRCSRREPPTEDGKCQRCQARIAEERRPRSRTRRTPATPSRFEESNLVVTVMILFGLLLLTSVIWGWVLLSNRGKITDDQFTTGTAVMEVVDSGLVLIGLLLVGRSSLPSPRPGARPLAWVVSFPGFAILMAGNLTYTAFLRDLVRPGGVLPPEPGITPLNVLLMCVQPAIIEELFFRYVAFGVFHRAAGLHSAVWVTAVMFAAAHIYNPLGMPYLFVAGLAFGYARVWGGLALPMVMHFFHNFALVALEGIQ